MLKILTATKKPAGLQDGSVDRSPEIKGPAHLIAVVLGLLPIYGFAVTTHLTKDVAYTVGEMLWYPLVLGGLGILWIAFLNRLLCNESLADMNFRPGAVGRDILGGVFLAAILYLLFFLEQATIYRWLARNNRDALGLIRGLAASPILLFVWLGPTVWLGVAGFEEVSRAFMLKRLWSVGRSRFARWAAIVASGALFGLAHAYQGPAGIAGTGILGLFQGWVYLRFGRIWPLIIAHALYDSVQIVWVVFLIRSGAV